MGNPDHDQALGVQSSSRWHLVVAMMPAEAMECLPRPPVLHARAAPQDMNHVLKGFQQGAPTPISLGLGASGPGAPVEGICKVM